MEESSSLTQRSGSKSKSTKSKSSKMSSLSVTGKVEDRKVINKGKEHDQTKRGGA